MHALESTLQAAYVGDWAHFSQELTWTRAGDAARVQADATQVGNLLAPAHFAQVISAFEAKHGQTPRIAIGSIWSKWHFAVLMPAYLIPTLLLGWDMDAALAVADYELDETGKTRALRVSASLVRMQTRQLDPRALLNHVAQCITVLGRHTGATERVLWSNAGNLFESFVQRVIFRNERNPDVLERCRLATQLMECARLHDGMPNPMYRPVVYRRRAHGAPLRLRRVCCIRFLVPDGRFCTSCPSPLATDDLRAC